MVKRPEGEKFDCSHSLRTTRMNNLPAGHGQLPETGPAQRVGRVMMVRPRGLSPPERQAARLRMWAFSGSSQVPSCPTDSSVDFRSVRPSWVCQLHGHRKPLEGGDHVLAGPPFQATLWRGVGTEVRLSHGTQDMGTKFLQEGSPCSICAPSRGDPTSLHELLNLPPQP